MAAVLQNHITLKKEEKENAKSSVWFKVLTAACVKMAVFWAVTTY
jgi:hypothetical protein